MKTKVVIVILAVVCVGLAIALFAAKKQGEEQHAADVSAIVDFSNQVVNASLKLNDLKQVNLALTNDLVTTRQQSFELSTDLSNKLAAAAASLATTTETLNASRTELAGAQSQITTLNTQVAGLEQQKQSLEQRAAQLSNNIVQLDGQIASTRAKLARAESGNAFLQQELQRQMAQRAELEHKLNDLGELRQQVKKLQTDLFVARRLQFMRNDTSDMKGAELLMRRSVTVPPVSAAGTAPANSLNVEVGSDGSVKVIPALPATTNSVPR